MSRSKGTKERRRAGEWGSVEELLKSPPLPKAASKSPGCRSRSRRHAILFGSNVACDVFGSCESLAARRSSQIRCNKKDGHSRRFSSSKSVRSGDGASGRPESLRSSRPASSRMATLPLDSFQWSQSSRSMYSSVGTRAQSQRNYSTRQVETMLERRSEPSTMLPFRAVEQRSIGKPGSPAKLFSRISDFVPWKRKGLKS